MTGTLGTKRVNPVKRVNRVQPVKRVRRGAAGGDVDKGSAATLPRHAGSGDTDTAVGKGEQGRRGKGDYESQEADTLAARTCPLCARVLSTKANCATHVMLVHDGRRPYKCGSCERRFGRKQDMMSHERNVHSRIANYACRKGCGKVFGESGNRSRHERTVHGKKRAFSCPQCDATFTQKHSRDTHIRTRHEHKKDFRCEIGDCKSAFGERSTLLRHQHNKHDAKEIPVYPCPTCGTKLESKLKLNRHQHYVHGGIVQETALQPPVPGNSGDGQGGKKDQPVDGAIATSAVAGK